MNSGPNPSRPLDEPSFVKELVRTSHEIASEHDPTHALWLLIETLRSKLGVDRAGIFSYDPQLRCLERVVGVSREGRQELAGEAFELGKGGGGPLLEVANRELPYYFSEDPAAEYPDRSFPKNIGFLAVIPIIAGGELLGAMAADNALTGRSVPNSILDALFIYARMAALPLFALYQKRERERADAARWHTLQSVFSAVTSGKMCLCKQEEIDAEWPAARELMAVRNVADVPPMRNRVRRCGIESGMDSDRARDLELCVSEAATNALLHGKGGAVSVEHRGGRIRVRVMDSGRGISLDDLPSATLQAGWSKRRSMGLGFTLINETADRLFLHTGSNGTTVIIEMAVEPEVNLPDACNPMLWGNDLSLESLEAAAWSE